MNAHSQERIGGVRSLVRGMAESGSMRGTWNEPVPQHVRLERSGSVDMPEFDTVSAVFEARRYFDERQRLATVYLARVAGSRELVSEELSDHIKLELAKATVSASVSEMVIATESMLAEDDPNGELMEFVDDDEGYRHTQTIEYRINGNGEILECQRSEEYDQNGEVSLRFAYSEPYRRGKLAVEVGGEFVRGASGFDLSKKKALKRELAVDVALLERAAEYRNDTSLIELSRREHEARIFAISAFITMQADPVKSLQIALA